MAWRSGSAQYERHRPWFERLLVGAENSVFQLDLQRPEPLERSGKLQLEDPVRRAVLRRELGSRRVRLAALRRFHFKVVRAKMALERGLIDVARELDPHRGSQRDV